jgi:hypothetical protein
MVAAIEDNSLGMTSPTSRAFIGIRLRWAGFSDVGFGTNPICQVGL